MAVYLVTWDLNREKPNYSSARDKFISYLDGFKDYCVDSGLDSARFISTDLDADAISKHLRKAQDDNDTLLVVRIYSGSDNRAGWLNKTTWTWIEARE